MSLVSFWPKKNLAETVDGPTLYVKWEEQVVVFCLIRQSAIDV
jgi:hypothetical protein